MIHPDSKEQITFVTKNNVAVTFVSHPYPPLKPLVSTGSINLFDLADLASNKAYAIGRKDFGQPKNSLVGWGRSINPLFREKKSKLF